MPNVEFDQEVNIYLIIYFIYNLKEMDVEMVVAADMAEEEVEAMDRMEVMVEAMAVVMEDHLNGDRLGRHNGVIRNQMTYSIHF